MASSQEIIEDSRFDEILRIEGIDLQQFFQEVPIDDLLPAATSYPAFFNENLVSPNRILKQLLNNPQSNIRVFYFQILRLGYQIEQEGGNNKNFIVNLRRIIFHPQFQILFTQQTQNERDLFNDFQFKRLFAQFILLLENQQRPIVQQILCHYPIMDSIFIHIFRSLLASQNINEEFDIKIPSEVVFTQLCNLLDLNITSYGNCWKFEDSDMFCYQQNQNEIFLAYIVEDGEIEEGGQQFEEQQPVAQQYGGYSNNQIHPDAVHANSNIIAPSNSYSNNYGVSNQVVNNHQVYAAGNNLTPNVNANTNVPINRIEHTNLYTQEDNTVTFKVNDYFNNNQQVNSSFKPEVYQEPVPRYEPPPYNPPAQNQNRYEPPRIEVPRYQPPKYQQPKYQPPRYEPPQPQYKPYQPPQYNNAYNPIPTPSSYQSVQQITTNIYSPEPVHPTSTFKPVEPTPMPTFDNFKSTYQPKRDYTKPASSYETSYNSYSSSYQVQSTYGSSVFDKDYKSPSSYKPTNYSSGNGDYYGDFTPPEILAKLKLQNRDNINKIRQSMRGIFKGGDLPQDFDVRKSAIHNTSTATSIPKQDYRNPSKSQFDYNDSYKYSAPSKPLTADLSTYMVNKPQVGFSNYTSVNYQSSYGNYSAY